MPGRMRTVEFMASVSQIWSHSNPYFFYRRPNGRAIDSDVESPPVGAWGLTPFLALRVVSVTRPNTSW